MAKSNATHISKKQLKTIVIAAVAIILVLAISLCVIYFAFPETWNKLKNLIFGEPVDDTATVYKNVIEFEDGDLSVHMLDVGQGDCILILFPDGKDMLIDCANYNDDGDIESKTYKYIDSYVKDGQLDYVMLTHCDSDHVYFLDGVLEHYQVDNIFMPNVLPAPTNETLKGKINSLDQTKIQTVFEDGNGAYNKSDINTVTSKCYAEFFYAAFTEPDCNIKLNVDADENSNSIVVTGSNYNLKFYSPTREYYKNNKLSNAKRKNAISPIGVLEYKGFKTLLTGDSNELNEPTFVSRIGGRLDCDVLKVAHHGSESSSTEEFLNAVTCEYAFISCNQDGNTFHHPRANTLKRFTERNMLIYRTDKNGNIVFVFNAKITVYVEKPSTQKDNRVGLDSKGNPEYDEEDI